VDALDLRRPILPVPGDVNFARIEPDGPPPGDLSAFRRCHFEFVALDDPGGLDAFEAAVDRNKQPSTLETDSGILRQTEKNRSPLHKEPAFPSRHAIIRLQVTATTKGRHQWLESLLLAASTSQKKFAQHSGQTPKQRRLKSSPHSKRRGFRLLPPWST